MSTKKNHKVFVAWRQFCTRSHNQATHFGAKEIYIFPLKNVKKNIAVLFARYLLSSFATIWRLILEKPDIVFTINTPIPLLTVIYLYCKATGARYILDSHSGPFNDPKWEWSKPLYAFIARRAFLNINTNSHHKMIVEQWGGRSRIMSDIPIDHTEEYQRSSVGEKSIAVVSSFMYDEPMVEIWNAAAQLPDVTFYVTGDEKKADQYLLDNKPDNLEFTGFIPIADYFSLLVSVDAIMVLTTRNHTMQMGAYEALSLEQPIITSDWPILHESFGNAATYTDNSAESIAEAVTSMLENIDLYRSNVKQQKKTRREYYESTREEILAELALLTA